MEKATSWIRRRSSGLHNESRSACLSSLQRANAGRATTGRPQVLRWQRGVIHEAAEVDGLPNASEKVKRSTGAKLALALQALLRIFSNRFWKPWPSKADSSAGAARTPEDLESVF